MLTEKGAEGGSGRGALETIQKKDVGRDKIIADIIASQTDQRWQNQSISRYRQRNG